MAFEIVDSGEKEKWQLSFMRQTSRKRKYSFPNYDHYDRREALKTFLQPSFFLNGNDEEEYVRDMLENPTIAKFATANHSAYGTAMDHALRAFVDNKGGLTNTTIQGINDSKPKHLMENPNTFSLFFKNKYNFNKRDPKTRSILDLGRYRLERNFRQKVEKEKKKLKKKTDEFDENGNRIYKDEEGNIIPTFNIGADGKQNNAEPENLDLRNLFKEDGEDNSEINYPVPQDSSDEEDEGEIKEATLGIKEHFANIESIVNKENGLGYYQELASRKNRNTLIRIDGAFL